VVLYTPERTYQTTPGKRDGHTHGAVVDHQGDGSTTLDGTRPHAHAIRAFRVLSADGHTHELLDGVPL
jgi:hypothetical protein